MSISTKTGDQGMTSLWTGERVEKDSVRVEAYGTIDELNSHIGESRHFCESEEAQSILLRLQRELFQIAGQLASKDKTYVEPVTDQEVEEITALVHDLEARVPLKGFVIPGNTVSSAKLDICRTIARRAERRIITLAVKEEVPKAVRMYVNRLSDLLFMLGRLEEQRAGKILYKNDVMLRKE
ncbi:MAG TPA: cob(I)yrinic acid a,c-diamide adenosyltransferase [Thermotogota bacterium]|nr:cob(I)yrinic acid a,c-diamide adenosyltransferase [Thermotogota bacterium]NLZ12668.1 cob(I)yrinic acid a,c-diamide adenosyltransferase [Thermotogaceae bacterium]MDD8042052.1 cob(I)yrinic acid a,c-diamide adenosyltransferase [Thermotogota bacterium]MDD8053430.1 cob(I)yrinic acid a,c-diamide adenosyltransferase [Thermotogota bacterium]HNR64508.1 cob(I)yrinic acid a,c-diamide adenosyltransferase [Thermotogota bacterium]